MESYVSQNSKSKGVMRKQEVLKNWFYYLKKVNSWYSGHGSARKPNAGNNNLITSQYITVNFEWLFKFSVTRSGSWENYSREFPLEIKQIGNMDCESILKSNREWHLACTAFYSCLLLVSISTSSIYQANLWKIRQELFFAYKRAFVRQSATNHTLF